MTTSAPLVIARRLAIQLLHAAQIAAPEAICGMVGAINGEPVEFVGCEQDLIDRGLSCWALVFSKPLAAAIPSVDELQVNARTLVISLNTKGVLEMRAWTLDAGVPVEHLLSIRD